MYEGKCKVPMQAMKTIRDVKYSDTSANEWPC